MWPTTAAAPVTATSGGTAARDVRERHRRCALGDVERHDGNGPAGSGRAHHVGRPDVAAAGNADVDAAPAREQKRERHRPREVSEQDRDHPCNGTRISPSYSDPPADRPAPEQRHGVDARRAGQAGSGVHGIARRMRRRSPRVLDPRHGQVGSIGPRLIRTVQAATDLVVQAASARAHLLRRPSRSRAAVRRAETCPNPSIRRTKGGTAKACSSADCTAAASCIGRLRP